MTDTTFTLQAAGPLQVKPGETSRPDGTSTVCRPGIVLVRPGRPIWSPGAQR